MPVVRQIPLAGNCEQRECGAELLGGLRPPCNFLDQVFFKAWGRGPQKEMSVEAENGEEDVGPGCK